MESASQPQKYSTSFKTYFLVNPPLFEMLFLSRKYIIEGFNLQACKALSLRIVCTGEREWNKNMRNRFSDFRLSDDQYYRN